MSPEPWCNQEPLIATTPVPRNPAPDAARWADVRYLLYQFLIITNFTEEASVPPPTPPTLKNGCEASAPPINTATPELTTGKLFLRLPPTESSKTQLRQQTANFCTSNKCNHCFATKIYLPIPHQEVKWRIPPDIDVSRVKFQRFSRIHADIKSEGGAYYIEDVGSF